MKDNFYYLLGIGFFILFIVGGIFYIGTRPKTESTDLLSSFVFQSPVPTYPLVTYLPLRLLPSPTDFSRTPAIQAESALLFDLTNEKSLFAKDPEKKLLIASLTKLMTALVASENASSKSQRFFVLDEDLKIENTYNDLKAGDNFNLEEALHFVLIRSDNVISQVLARSVLPEGSRFFAFEMNKRAQQLRMQNTLYYDSIGLENNLSTAMDLKNLVEEILKSHQEIFLISKIPEIKIVSPENKVYSLKNTNVLVTKIPGIFGSKTGFTPEAAGSLLVIFKDGQKMILSVVLGSQYRFGDISDLVNWYWKNRQEL